ncbi:MAG: S9 family peptidase [Saprospiraceae bacterium]|nr:S9 family peptidase [Saprospiraceae bacterium]
MSTQRFFLALLCFTFAFFSCKQKDGNSTQPMENKDSKMFSKSDIIPPIAVKIPKTIVTHGDTMVDNYFWMRLSDAQKNAQKPDEQTKKVLDYLTAENAYREKMMSHTDSFQNRLFEEIKGRIKQTDMSVPYKDNGYFYITRFEEGKEYAIHSRKKGSLEAQEEILLNVNNLAEGHEYYAVGGRTVSPDNKILAYSEDTVSRRQYTIRFKDLITGKNFDDVIPVTSGGITWGNDNKTIFYTKIDATLRSFKIYRHTLGTPVKNDQLIWHEKDETFSTFIYKTKSKKYLIIGSAATLSNEYQVLEADNPTGKFRMFQPRERKLEYGIDHYGDSWYIHTNKDDAQNFKIMVTPETATTKENWKDLMPYDKNIFIEGIDLFKDHMVISERKGGITQLRIRPWSGQDEHYVQFGEESYTTGTGINPDFETDLLRLDYTSLTTPNTTYDYNVKTKKLEKLKQQEVVGSFKAEDYVSERKMVKAQDGTMIPLSIVYKKGFKKVGSQPFLLFGYGSYGASMDPYFSSVRLSLLDRGFGFAIAHIRGGQEMGRQWYEDGKYLKKKNTFTDFIDCGDYLLNEKYVAKDKLFANGGSAGGLLMGAVMNMKPEIWKGIIAAVPFVDVINTMLDESIPLTTGEFDEWGNPKDKEYYAYMKSYSPYDNVEAKAYPATLVTTGYWDSQVQYWEPAKWVAKLRELKTDKNPLLMYCNMDTGHGGASGRFRRYRETAMEYAFLLDLAGLGED